MKLIEVTTAEPGLPLAKAERHDLDEDIVGKLVDRLNRARQEHGREDAYRHSGLPPLVLNQHREVVNGRHRDEACGRADVPPQVSVFQFEDAIAEQEQVILENLARQQLTPDQVSSDLAALVRLRMVRKDVDDDDAEHAQPAHAARKKASKEREAIREVASETGRSERTVERAVKRDREPASPIVEKAPKPKPVEQQLADMVPQLEVLNAALNVVRRSMDAAAQQYKWNHSDIRWRYLQDIGKANAGVSNAAITLKEVSERMAKAKVQVFTTPVKALGEKPVKGSGAPTQEDIEQRIAKGGGLKAPARKPRVKVTDQDGNLLAEGSPTLPSPEDIRRTWDEGAALFGPDGENDDEGAF